jgi:titin
MSDYTITGASAAFNPSSPAPLPDLSTVNIEVELTFAGTLATPFTLSAQATNTSADAVSWTQVVNNAPSSDPGNDFKFIVTAQSSAVHQPTLLYQQNYLVTVVDNDARTQVFNIALENQDGYPTARLERIEGYPSPRGIATTPASPTDLQLAQIGFPSTQYDLSWTAGSGGAAITGYKIARAVRTGITNGPFAVLVADTGDNNTSFSDTGLTVNQRYTYKVAAINAIIGISDFSVESPTLASIPSAVLIQKLGAHEHRTQLDVTWTAPDDDGASAITGYKIERSPDDAAWAVIEADTGNQAVEYVDSGPLSPSTPYYYRVSAINGVGTTTASASAMGTTDAISAPNAPTDLTATAVSASQINLAWTAPADDGGSAITGYKIERESPIGGGWATIVGDTGSAATTYNNGSLTGGVQYNYRVSALNAIGSSSAGDAADDTTPAGVPGAPTGLSASPISATRIDLSWSAPSDNGSALVGYKIERETPIGGGFSTLVSNTGSTSTSYSDLTCVTATQYNYKVSGINGIGTGPASSPANATTP